MVYLLRINKFNERKSNSCYHGYHWACHRLTQRLKPNHDSLPTMEDQIRSSIWIPLRIKLQRKDLPRQCRQNERPQLQRTQNLRYGNQSILSSHWWRIRSNISRHHCSICRCCWGGWIQRKSSRCRLGLPRCCHPRQEPRSMWIMLGLLHHRWSWRIEQTCLRKPWIILWTTTRWLLRKLWKSSLQRRFNGQRIQICQRQRYCSRRWISLQSRQTNLQAKLRSIQGFRIHRCQKLQRLNISCPRKTRLSRCWCHQLVKIFKRSVQQLQHQT